MGEWHCFKCEEKMTEDDVEASYLDTVQFIDCLKCPKCGAVYLTEEYVIEVVNKGEEELEAKLG
jgi:NAD-dependent SIR2 family protein deacetylase